MKTIKAILINSKTKFAKNNALGTIKSGEKSTIEYIAYDQFFKQTHAIGSALINKQLYNTDIQSKFNFVGIFSKNRKEWSIVDIACCLFKLTTVPIYDTLGDENITYVLKHV